MNIEHEVTFSQILKLFEDTPNLVVKAEDEYLESIKHLPSGWYFFTGTRRVLGLHRKGGTTLYPSILDSLFRMSDNIRIQKQFLKYRNAHQTPI